MRISHQWDVSISEAAQVQKKFADSVMLTSLEKPIHLIAGADVSFGRFSDHFFAGIVVLTYPGFDIVEESYADMQVKFRYVPGYLSFREVPVIAKAYVKLKRKPDLIMMDGQGIAHPRHLGVASHTGLLLDIPTIGCAKSLLYGTGDIPASEKGDTSEIRDPKTGEILGAYVRTKRNVKPVIVSPGHKVTLAESINIVLSSAKNHRLPEPTRLAHNLVNAYRVRKTTPR